jgi:hypothetical protein
MNSRAVFMLMYNTTSAQLELSKRTFESIINQDVGPLDIVVVDNGSAIDTKTYQWIGTLRNQNGHTVQAVNYQKNISPCLIANIISSIVFGNGHETLLGVPNDVVLPMNLYREMEKWPQGFIAAWMNGDVNYRPLEKVSAVYEDIHMSVTLSRKLAHDSMVKADGYLFDAYVEGSDPQRGFFMYASDCDFKRRMKINGVSGVQLDIQCYHWGSACWRLATPEVSKEINVQADKDRAYYARKWGGLPGQETFDLPFRESKIWS